MTDGGFAALAKKMLEVLYGDLPLLNRIQEYVEGKQDKPYVPEDATDEYKLIVQRCFTNVTPLLEGTPAQACYVDGFRPGRDMDEGESALETPEWKHWQRSLLDSRQVAIHRGALRFGHSFTVTEIRPKGVFTRGLSPLRTTALFEDPANDLTPTEALTVVTWPVEGDEKSLGRAIGWDATYRYDVKFTAGGAEVSATRGPKHGNSECPVTRFAVSIDLEGRTTGVVWPFKEIQDRINQSVFDLLLAQTYGSTNVRTAAGIVLPIERDPVTGEPILDETGQPKAKPLRANVSRFMAAEDPETKFGSLPATPLDGFISSIDLAFRHLSAISQTPPHHLLGQIANLSAEALEAAAQSGERKAQEIRVMFGEAWERVFRLAAELEGIDTSAEDYSGEVVWRDVDGAAMSRSADALGKIAAQLQVPAKGLWPRVPGVTQTELQRWQELADEDPEAMLAQTLNRASMPSQTAGPSDA